MAERDTPPFLVREASRADIEWVVRAHATLYEQEYGWGEAFQRLVAGVADSFLASHDPRRERCWIAEVAGKPAGSVMIVQHPERATVAKLRLLLVTPDARGLGIGTRLIHQCAEFARDAGYERISLWTNSVLHTARALYEADGYTLVHSEPHDLFGHGLVGETWERAL